MRLPNSSHVGMHASKISRPNTTIYLQPLTLFYYQAQVLRRAPDVWRQGTGVIQRKVNIITGLVEAFYSFVEQSPAWVIERPIAMSGRIVNSGHYLASGLAGQSNPAGLCAFPDIACNFLG